MHRFVYLFGLVGLIIILNQMRDSNSLNLSSFTMIDRRFSIDVNAILGHGASGVVYKGYDCENDAIIAIKQVQRNDSSKRLKRELEIMEELRQIQHPNIVGFFGHLKTENYVYFMLQFCSGGSLKSKIATGISELRAIVLFRQILEAMAYLNNQNKMHRDLKPDNILLDENEDIKIADFGLAKPIGKDLVNTSQACTPIYGAPQILYEKCNYNEKCDVWSAGLILYEILTGQKVFDEKKIRTHDMLQKSIKAFKSSKHRLSIPPTLDKIWEFYINRMLEYDFEKRPGFAQLEKQFRQTQNDLRVAIIKKYKLLNRSLALKDVQQEHIKTKSPYILIPSKISAESSEEARVIMGNKLKEEKSYILLNNLRKWYSFTREKNLVLVGLVDLFVEKKYDCIKNVFKYILMFLSGMAFLTMCQKRLQIFQKGAIDFYQRPIKMEDFAPYHRSTVSNMIEMQKKRMKKYIKNFKQKTLKPYILKKLQQYIARPESKAIIQKQKELMNLITGELKQAKPQPAQVYLQKFHSIADSPNVYTKNGQLTQLNKEELQVYLQIRMISKFDKCYSNIHYKNEDYLKMLVQKIANYEPQELIQMIIFYN